MVRSVSPAAPAARRKPAKGFKPTKRTVLRIQLTPEAKKAVLGVTDKYGITQIAVQERFNTFFAQQPEEIQAEILGLYPDGVRQDIGKLLLKRMAAGAASA